jgi:4-hydroxybenzoate polyprenyltransferase
MAVERGAFIFAITIPFDIRDMSLDAVQQLDTLPGVLGENRAKKWAYLSLAIMIAAVLGSAHWSYYALPTAVALLLSASSTVWMVWKSTAARHDYYFTGLLDGTMLIQAGLVWLLN